MVGRILAQAGVMCNSVILFCPPQKRKPDYNPASKPDFKPGAGGDLLKSVCRGRIAPNRKIKPWLSADDFPKHLNARRMRAPHQTARIIPLRNAALLATAFTLMLWLIHLIDAFVLPAVAKPGVYPRTQAGLIGILLAPLVHDSFEHLISNTLPLLLLGTGMIFLYPKSSKIALPFLYIAPGLGVWLFARSAYHLGASGLSYGIMFFVLIIGMLRKDRGSVAFSMIVLFLYGGMLLGLLPEDSDISFEYHLFGALTGAACAFALRGCDPQPPPAKYDWEDEDDDLGDPVIGDQWRLPKE